MKMVMFDLGNVLLHFDHRLIGRNLEGMHPGVRPPVREAVWKRVIHDAELGTIAPSLFLDTIAGLLDVRGRVAHEDLALAWCNIFWRNDLMIDLVRQLRNHTALVLLSNTNQLHLDHIRAHHADVLDLFDLCVFSHEEHLAKPDLRIFYRALERVQISAADCLYFDDLRRHVDAATATGIHAYQYVSTAGVREILAAHGLPVAATRHD